MPDQPLTIVFGASGEMGSAIARTLAKDGHRLFLHGNRNQSKLKALATELGVPEERCALADVREDQQVLAVVRAAETNGPLSGLVYAVGWNPTAATIDETTVDDWCDTLDINLTGAFRALRSALPGLRATGSARVVLVSSIFGLNAPARRGAYSASKHGLKALVEGVAKEEGERVQVNGICPGAMWSENVRHIFASHAESSGQSLESYVKSRVSSIPAGRFVTPEECARVTAFLMSANAGFVSGEMIRISGGEV